jgi:hypothetical protein
MGTMMFAAGLAAGMSNWLLHKSALASNLRGLGAALCTLLLLQCSIWCRRGISPDWWAIPSILIGVAAGTLIVIRSKPGRSGAGIALAALAVGIVVRLIVQNGLHDFVAVVLKYSAGYGVSLLAPVAIAVLCSAALVRFLRASAGAAWFWIALVYAIFAGAFFFTSPLLDATPRQYVGDFVLGALPCAGALVVLGARRDLVSRVLTVVALCALIGFILFNSPIPPAGAGHRGLLPLLLTPPAVGVCCVVTLAFAGWCFHRIKNLDIAGAGGTPLLLIVVMPWAGLVPAFYCARLGLQWLILYALANVLIGAALFVPLFAPPAAFSTGPSRARRVALSSLSRYGAPSGGVWPKVLPDFEDWTGGHTRLAGVTLVLQLAVASALPFRPPPPPRIVSFKASVPSVSRGSSATLKWSVSDATSASVYPGRGPLFSNSNAKSLDGTLNVAPATTTVYVLSAAGAGGLVVTSQVRVEVTGPPIDASQRVAKAAPASTSERRTDRPQLPRLTPRQEAETQRQMEELARQQADLERQQAHAAAERRRRAEALGLLDSSGDQKR